MPNPSLLPTEENSKHQLHLEQVDYYCTSVEANASEAFKTLYFDEGARLPCHRSPHAHETRRIPVTSQLRACLPSASQASLWNSITAAGFSGVQAQPHAQQDPALVVTDLTDPSPPGLLATLHAQCYSTKCSQVNHLWKMGSFPIWDVPCSLGPTLSSFSGQGKRNLGTSSPARLLDSTSILSLTLLHLIQ